MAGKRTRRASKRGEDDTGAKAGAVEVRTIGDNSQLKLPAPDDFDYHYKTIRGARDKVQTAQSLASSASKSANKCCPGLAKVIKETLKIEDDGDPSALQRHLEMIGMGLRHINSPIQLTVFDNLAGEAVDQVYARGKADGAAGRSSDNRYPENSDLHHEYARGWRHGTAENFGLSPDEADAAVGETEFDAASDTEDAPESIAAE